MIKGVIYDMDDLMVNSNPLHFRATEEILKKYGYSLNGLPEEFTSNLIGKRVKEILEDIFAYLKINNISIYTFGQERSQLFLSLVKNDLEAMPSLKKSLIYFKNEKYRIALASSSTKEYINVVLKKFALQDFFEVIMSGEDVKMAKPDPEIYELTCQELKLSPGECLVLEDSDNGILAAKAAGCKCIAIPSPHTPPQTHQQADIILDSLADINIKIINSLK